MASSDIWILTVGLLATIVMIVVTASARRTVAIGVLLALLPFQVIETRYASSSVLMAYAMAGTMIMIGGLRVRLLPSITLVLLAYVLSITQAKQYLSFHLIELFQFASCFVVFLLAYNYARLVGSVRTVTDLLLLVNVLVILYCALQVVVGPGNAFKPFGLEELAFNSNRDPGDPRLVGPFANPGTTAGYFALMTILWAASLLYATGGRRRLAVGLILANIAGIVASGNRASFLVLLAALPILLFAFRRELGPRRFFQYLLGGFAAVMLASAAIAVYSGFGNMFKRLEVVTETENGMPMTRANTWTVAIEKIKRDPWFGEGPHFLRSVDVYVLHAPGVEYADISDVESVYDPYPHSLYLFLLRTVGIIGLAAMMAFFAQVAWSLRRALSRDDLDESSHWFVKAGLVMIGAFLVTQITLEFNRTDTMDYAQYVLALMGLLVGVGDRPSAGTAGRSGSGMTGR